MSFWGQGCCGAVMLAACCAAPAHAARIELNLATLSAPGWEARDIVLDVHETGAATLSIARLKLAARVLQQAQLQCGRLELSSREMQCLLGRLSLLPGAALTLRYGFQNRRWQLDAHFSDTPVQALQPWLATGDLQGTNGALNGHLSVSGEGGAPTQATADLRFDNLGFSGAGGLHAAEKLGGRLHLNARHGKGTWTFEGQLDWTAGELYWEPVYLAASGPRRLAIKGRYDGHVLDVTQGQLDDARIGQVAFNGRWDGALQSAHMGGRDLQLQPLFADLLKPFMAGSAMADAALDGRADLNIEMQQGAIARLRLALHDAGLHDDRQRFALQGLNSTLDWQPDLPATVPLRFSGGSLLGIPFGAAQWHIKLQGKDLTLEQASLPILGGHLALDTLHLGKNGVDWSWQFGAALQGVSMTRLSQALHWPEMFGTLSGRIPSVRYDGGTIRTTGTLQFDIFDGTIRASGLNLYDPFGPAPRLEAELAMRNLDLDLLTRTFSFGSIEGRIDADVQGLELQNWSPARFDARLASSPGRYRKTISQRAVQNISALGGAGAAAAIQRSYLRFFERFGYDEIVWHCRLSHGVCAMGGGGTGTQGGYPIVTGGGIPAIIVMGYNRAVSWDELLARLKRVTQGNTKAIVK